MHESVQQTKTLFWVQLEVFGREEKKLPRAHMFHLENVGETEITDIGREGEKMNIRTICWLYN